jgi:hypothetical protein
MFPLVTAVLAFLATQAGSPILIPPANTGVINGRTAILAWPADSANHPLDATGCEVHLVPYADQNIERTYPCGEWFQPEVGKYRYWLEKDGSYITPYPSILTYVGKRFEGSSLQVLMPLAPAGKVALTRPQSPDLWLRIVHIPAASDHPEAHRSFDRRVPGDRTAPLLMPEGSIVAGLFDREGNAVALTRPVRTSRDQLVRGLRVPPRAGTDVLAVLERDGIREKTPEYDAHVVLRVDGREYAPDVASDTANRVVCLWYGVAARQAEFVFRSAREFLPSEVVHLRPGGVVTLRRRLAKLPDLHVAITAPRALPNMKLKVLPLDENASPIRVVDATVGDTVIASLPAEELLVVLEHNAWRFKKRIDLRSASDTTLQFDLKPMTVTGGVFRGDSPSDGRVTFTTGTRDLATTMIDQLGRYSVELWASGVYVARVETPESEPFLKGFIEVDGDTTVDFHVPLNRFRVLVSDDRSGAPIRNAVVSVTNIDETATAVRQVETRHTDEAGVAILPPLKDGRATIEAFAEAYEKGAPIESVIDSSTRSRDISIRLKPFGSGYDFRIYSVSGVPAIGAEIAVVSADSGDGIPVWRGTYSDENGIRVPDIGRSLLLVRCHGSASAVVPLPPTADAPAIRLAPEAAPLVMEAVTTAGEPVPWARVALWFDQYRMTSASLGFLTWSQGAASSQGIWVANGLGTSTTRALVWRGNSLPVRTGTYDALSQVIAFPWRGVARVAVVN